MSLVDISPVWANLNFNPRYRLLDYNYIDTTSFVLSWTLRRTRSATYTRAFARFGYRCHRLMGRGPEGLLP
jgi:hypothetical protein